MILPSSVKSSIFLNLRSSLWMKQIRCLTPAMKSNCRMSFLWCPNNDARVSSQPRCPPLLNSLFVLVCATHISSMSRWSNRVEIYSKLQVKWSAKVRIPQGLVRFPMSRLLACQSLIKSIRYQNFPEAWRITITLWSRKSRNYQLCLGLSIHWIPLES